MIKVGLHDQILEIQQNPLEGNQLIGYTLAHLETDLDQMSNAIAKARMNEIPIPANVRSIIAGFRSQLRQAEAACGKSTS
jgi:hypothetical protein